MSHTTAAARNSLRAAVASALIVVVTGIGVQTSWADEVTGTTADTTTCTVTDPTDPTGTTGTTGTTGDTTTCNTDNNPWD
ncbi:hypothetical protein ACFW2Y_25275 [Streptomyces sp. NPDC058877]|uniref:hypothetical protein n=1 Tax=unclassified Streptomyces TaxID=2593676 RepID=UPI003689780D